MFSQEDDGQQGLLLTVVFGVIALVIALVIVMSTYKSTTVRAAGNAALLKTAVVKSAAAMREAVSANPMDVANVAQAATDAASVMVENGVVKFFFASGTAHLATGAGDALLGVINGAKAGRTLVVSGFHDVTGNAGKNTELATQRALAVRAALMATGVTEQQILLIRPGQMTATDSDAEARRVEVSLQ